MVSACGASSEQTPEQLELERIKALDPNLRYWAGFDRWSYAALSRREITVAFSNAMTVVLDNDFQLWFWDREWKIWFGIGEPAEAHVHAENRIYVTAMRRAVPIIRLLLATPNYGERKAAEQALARIAAGVRKAFQASPASDGSSCWVGTAGLYRSTTSGNRWQIADLNPPAWEECIETALRKSEEPEMQAFSRHQ